MSIANRILARYESEDFKNDYAEYLLEDSHAVIDRIIELCKNEYDVEKYYGGNIDLTRDQADQILQYIFDNIEEFTSTYNGYWVGSTSLDSVSFGEQQEELTGLTNHKTGKYYTLPYLRRAFNDAGYMVSGNDAYYDMSGEGVHIDLLGAEIPMLKAWIDEQPVIGQ